MSTREELLKAACRHFGEGGYGSTPLSAIAGTCGIKTPSIYAFYKNKDALYLAAFRHVLESHYLFLKRAVEAKKDAPPEEQLFSILRGLVDFHDQETELTQFYKQAYLVPPHHLKAEMDETFRHYDRLLSALVDGILQRLIDEGIVAKGNRQAVLSAWFCLMDGIFLEMFYYPKEELDERLCMIWKIFWDGLKNSRTDDRSDSQCKNL
ncbi:TetR/AcrR family transcriptional regulator [Kyrpidia spormannii]|uniref:Uncharacterized protein n=2 Tax=Kyrpidia spormannii TaxID=2055160 RepID=A0ACA8Z9A2_9BACL|nr:TetR/AcrR family transcriptional regulator [Kyrpidia spormannii]CAB3392758.1 conserved protein of unknown function [Kyrpidia spormannii]CAB3393672.1 conserved protein of unknown function [Kyrpidia spormannii]